MRASTVYVAIAKLRDATAHRAYNEYHQLDHQPEYRAVEGVVHADRWVRSPDSATYHRVPSFLDELQYFNLQWLASPLDRAIANYSELAEQLLISGRRSDIGLLDRLFLGYFRAIKGYVSPRLTVSPGALLFRPNRGLFVTVSQLAEPGTLEADRYLVWRDRTVLPAVLNIGGVAGAWTFSSDPTVNMAPIPSLGDAATSQRVAPGIVLTVAYLDGDPATVAPEISSHLSTVPNALEGVAVDLYCGPVRTITPWQWDWFDPTTT